MVPDQGEVAPVAEEGVVTEREIVDEADLEAHPTLELVQRYAVQNNPAIRAADYRWSASKRRIPQVRSYRNPTISYEPDTGNNTQTRAGQVANSVGISQAIPFPGKLTLRGRIAGAEADAVYEGLRATIDEVSSQARKRYADYYLSFRSLEINAETTDLVRQFEVIARAKYRVGTTAQQDVILAQERLSRLATERVVFEGDRDRTLGALNTVLDRAPRAIVGKPGEMTATELSVSLDDLVGAAIRTRPELQGQEHLVEASKRAVKLAKMEYLPDFEIGGRYSQVDGGTNPGFAKDGQDIWSATLGFSVPVWINRVRAEVAEAEALLMQEQSRYRDLRNLVYDQIQTAYEDSRVASRNEAIYRRTLIPQTRERIAAARAGYETGEVDFLTLIDSLNSLEEVRLDRYRAIRDHQRAVADLERAVGQPISEVNR